MQHYVRFRKARRDLVTLAAIVQAHEELTITHNGEILGMLSQSGSNAASAEESLIAASLVPMETSQSRARLLTVAIFFSIMSHMTPTSPDERIKPHEAVRVSKHVFDVLRRPGGGELGCFLQRFGVAKDEVVQAVLTDFVHAGKNLKLQRMLWRPPSRMSSHEILFQCWLIVNHNIGRLNEGIEAHPDVEEHLALFQQSAQSLEAISTPVGCSIDDAFASGCLCAASAKLIRRLHGISLTRTTPKVLSVSTSMGQSSHSGRHDIERTHSLSDFQNFDQNFGEWDNWQFNSTLNMVQLLQEDMFS